MKTAVIFPDQGSQNIGMGYDFYKNFESSKNVFDRLNLILEKDAKSMIFSGNETELSETENSQPAIMATSIAIFEAIMSENIMPNNFFQAVAGHSLGEYSALVANGSLELDESVRLLKIRSKAMQESMPLGTGGMIALIGFENNAIDDLLKNVSDIGKIFLANDNANGQVVLSGEIAAIDFVLNNIKEFKIKRAIKLSVSAPFHCKLMKHASDVLKIELEKTNFKNFSVPLYSNVTSKQCHSSEIAELLVSQVVSKVRWREIVENMIKDGFTRFIEIGPGKVLTNLVKRISKDVEVYSVSKIEDLEALKNIKT